MNSEIFINSHFNNLFGGPDGVLVYLVFLVCLVSLVFLVSLVSLVFLVSLV